MSSDMLACRSSWPATQKCTFKHVWSFQPEYVFITTRFTPLIHLNCAETREKFYLIWNLTICKWITFLLITAKERRCLTWMRLYKIVRKRLITTKLQLIQSYKYTMFTLGQPEKGAWVRISLSTNVNTPFLQVHTPSTHTSIWAVCFLNGTWVLGVPSVWMQHYLVPVPSHQCSGTKCEYSLS